jgi:hypothetical protein
MHALTKNLHLEPPEWRIIAAFEVVQHHCKKDFYVQNYTFPSFTRNAWTCAHRSDERALDASR